ncbi:MAG: glycine cleavage system protein GcvH [Proteobacteria bacterium]|nr:glycine cleavage system protein GcvH [Pseudomonadota bacterium]
MALPKNYKYTKEHEWLDVQGNSAVIGVTDFAVEQLGDIVHVDLPAVGKTFKAGDSFGTIESTKTVSDLYMPATGTITEVNNAVKSAPESLQSDSFKNGWLVKVQLSNPSEVNSLLDAAAYETFTKE